MRVCTFDQRRLKRYDKYDQSPPFMEVRDLDIQKKVYEAEDIQKLLGLGRSKTYLFLEQVYEKQEPFRVIKIGRLYRVPKKSFDDWLNGEVE